MANGKMTVQDVWERVQRTFGDDAAVQVNQQDIIRWVNDCQREIVMQHENLLQSTGFISSVANQQAYQGPEDCFMINSIWYRDSDDADANQYALRFVATPEMNRLFDGWLGTSYSQDYPIVFTRGDNGAFQVFPVPTTSRTNGFRVSYARYAVDLTSISSEIDLPAYYHQTVLAYCLMQAYEMDEDWESADRKAQFIQSTIDGNSTREQWFGHETYPTISTEFQDF